MRAIWNKCACNEDVNPVRIQGTSFNGFPGPDGLCERHGDVLWLTAVAEGGGCRIQGVVEFAAFSLHNYYWQGVLSREVSVQVFVAVAMRYFRIARNLFY